MADDNKKEPTAEAKSKSKLQGLINFGLLLVVLVHPTQATVRQIADYSVAHFGLSAGLAAKIPTIHFTVADVLLWFVFGLWVLRILTGGAKKPRFVSLPIMAFLVICGLSLVPAFKPAGQSPLAFPALSPDKSTGAYVRELIGYFTELIQYAEYFLVAYLLFVNNAADERRLRRMAYALFVACTVVVVCAADEYFSPKFGEDAVIEGRPAHFYMDSTFGFKGEQATKDHIGTRSNRNVLGAYLALMVPLMWGVVICHRNILVQLWLFVVCAAGMAFTLAGGAFVSMSAAMLAITYMRKEWLFVLLAAALVCGVVYGLPAMPRDNLGLLTDSVILYKSDNTTWPWQQRYVEWQPAIDGITMNPLVGVGLGRYQKNIGQYYGDIPKPGGTNLMEPDAINYYCVLGLEAGIPALLALFWILLRHARYAARAYARLDRGLQKGLALGTCGSLLAFAMNSFFTSSIVRGVAIGFILILALSRLVDVQEGKDEAAQGNLNKVLKTKTASAQ